MSASGRKQKIAINPRHVRFTSPTREGHPLWAISDVGSVPKTVNQGQIYELSQTLLQSVSWVRRKDYRIVGAFMGRKLLNILYAAFLLISIGGCASTSLSSSEPPQGPTPNYRAIIAKSLIAKSEFDDRGGSTNIYGLLNPNQVFYFRERGGIFQANKKVEHVEISDTIRMVQTNLYGWAWEACIRLTLNNLPATYAVFISDGVVVDARAAIQTDNCGNGNYAPLDVRDERSAPVNRAARKTGNKTGN